MSSISFRTSTRGILLFLTMMLLIASFVNVSTVSAQTSPNLVVTPSTQTLLPGVDNSIRFTIENTGDTGITDVVVTLTLPPSSASGTPMILKNSDGRFSLGDLSGSSHLHFNAVIYVGPLAANSLYQLTLAIAYQQSLVQKTETRVIGVSVPVLNAIGASISAALSVSEIKAGQNNTVVLNLTNVGDANAEAVSGTVVMPGAQSGSLPLSLVGSDGKFAFEAIGQDQSRLIPMVIYASPISAGSVYPISVTITYTDYVKTKQETKYLALGVPLADLPSAKFNVTLTPQDLKSGIVNNLNLTLSNTGDSIAEKIAVSLSLPAQGTSSPYVLLGSDGSWDIDRLAPGEKTVIPLSIFLLPAASGSVSAVTVTATYSDLRYKTKQQVNYLGFIVAGSVDLVILDTSTYPQNITLGKPFSLTITLINLGTTTAQSVIVVPSNATNIQPSSAQGIFLGDLTVNVPSSLTLTYVAGTISSGVYHLRIQFTYKDDLGRTLTDYLDVPAMLTVGNGSSDTNPQPQTGRLLEIVLPLLAVVVISVVGIYLYRRRKNKASGPRE